MSQLYNVYPFLEHVYDFDDEAKITDLNTDFLSESNLVPGNHFPVTRDVVSGCVTNIDTTGYASCVSKIYKNIKITDDKNDSIILNYLNTFINGLHDKVANKVPKILDISDTNLMRDCVNNFFVENNKFVQFDVNSIFGDSFTSTNIESFESAQNNSDTTVVSINNFKVSDEKKYFIEEDTTQQLPTLEDLIPNPAYKFAFELDTFQKQAILCLERNQSIFVAAHTSSGKTVVADYACALCRRRGSRVIYTSPIKALSNQKFYDFRRVFKNDVGLVTGDIKLAPESTFLIMTTEILYNMLCNSADIIRDLEIVIMDEVHYVNDVERGHVWEQIMIMLPKHVLLVLLSATVPNKLDFADWLGRIRNTEIHVIATNKRPVPLEHFLFTGLDGQNCRDHLHLIVDQNNQFQLVGYKRAEVIIKGKKQSSEVKKVNENKSNDADKDQKKGHFKRGGKVNTPGNVSFKRGSISVYDGRTKNLWLGVVRLLKECSLMPAIAFAFSRSALETLASHLGSVDLLDAVEKKEVKQFLRYSIGKRLSKSDQKLPSVLFISNLIVRGLAVHHAGMLPLLKETVEMLFQRGLIRLLFATETFAMGVNMPARCVIFTSLEKFDGQKCRPLNPSEYTQMAGRSGRRGLDLSGTVIILLGGTGVGKSVCSAFSGLPSEHTLSSIIMGRPTQLISKFKITYSMILHLHRRNGLTPQNVMRRSFMELSNFRKQFDRQQWLTKLQRVLKETTTILPSAGSIRLDNSLISPSRSANKSLVAVSAFSATTNDITFGEPGLQVNCPFKTTSTCANDILSYYQECCRLRLVKGLFSQLLGEQTMSELQRLFCTGRLVFVQLSPSSLNKKGGSFAQDQNREQCDWLVPAVIIDYSKMQIKNKSAVFCNAITWQLPSLSHNDFERQFVEVHANSTSSAGIDSNEFGKKQLIDENDEEKVLRDGEDIDLAQLPFPPQLMPVYAPSTLAVGLERLVLVSELSTKSVVFICDEVVNLKTGIHNPSISTAEHLLKAIRTHRQQLAASDAGLCLLMQKPTTTTSDFDPIFLLDSLNEAMFQLVTSIIPNTVTTRSDNEPVRFGLPLTRLNKADVAKILKLRMKMNDELSVIEEWDALNQDLANSFDSQKTVGILQTCPNLVAHLHLVHRTCRRRWAIQRIEQNLSDSNLQLNTEYLGRLHVLQELGFIDIASENGCLALKGRVACELTNMEVLLTQLLLDGSLTKQSAPDIAAILSCFLFETRPDSQHDGSDTDYLKQLLTATENLLIESENCSTNLVPLHLVSVVRKIIQSAIKLKELQMKYGLMNPEQDTRISLQLVNAVYAWASGNSFSTVSTMTNVSEGHIIRSLLQLDELLRHICSSCYLLGDRALSLRMTEARQSINRDLVCAPSLYISDEYPHAEHQMN